jgi:hypothetical protein
MIPAHLLPSPVGFPPRQSPNEALYALAGHLREQGITSLYGCACDRFGVLSVSAGVSVWTNGRVLWWHTADGETTWPAADPEGAVRILSSL